MSGKIELFNQIQKIGHLIGIRQVPSQSNRNILPNGRRIVVYASLTYLLIATIAFVHYEAQTVEEYVGGFLTATLAITVLAFYAVLVWESKNITVLIGKIEDFMEMSEPFVIPTLEFAN